MNNDLAPTPAHTTAQQKLLEMGLDINDPKIRAAIIRVNKQMKRPVMHLGRTEAHVEPIIGPIYRHKFTGELRQFEDSTTCLILTTVSTKFRRITRKAGGFDDWLRNADIFISKEEMDYAIERVTCRTMQGITDEQRRNEEQQHSDPFGLKDPAYKQQCKNFEEIDKDMQALREGEQ